MAKKFQPKDKFLRNLVKSFEESLEENKNIFFPEDELESLIDYYEVIPDYGMAVLAVEKAVELFPYSGVFHLKRAQLLIEIKDYDAAWESIDTARVFTPNATELKLLECDLLTAEGSFNEAISLLVELQELVPDSELPDVFLEKADVYEISGNTKLLASTLSEILQRFPENEEAVHRFWTLCNKANEFSSGIDVFQKNIELRPYNFLSWYYLAKCYEEIGLLEKAVDAYEYTLAINDYYFAYWDYAFCLQLLENYDKAIEIYYEMLELFDQEMNIYFEIGHCYQLKKEYLLARKSYQSVLDVTTSKNIKATAYFYLGRSFESEKQYSLALEHFKKASSLNQKHAKYHNAIGKVEFLQENIENAANAYIKSLAINDEQGKVWRRLAKCYYLLEFQDILLEGLSKACTILPLNSKLQYHYAAYLFHFGYKQAGLHQLEKALLLDSQKKNTIFDLFPELEKKVDILRLFEQFEN